ncbi:potassium-transporting ATPase subunit C [Rugosimonospora africana]|uniref:Potassium-transporting ATPase KdpC subunit n=1 Tax=Rugosimonospora africana TaxID=556532 RepID=A0A8J3VMQ2_9ACTN|nr:potassium-transporting ATPase subunit C [Rugosimonospora africana]GIH11937.1 potassium-transporting ATPase KdpC subunit [Rugosimonospora africana]
MRLPSWIAAHLTALRAVILFTVLLGIAYPLVLVGIGQIPGLAGRADGSLVTFKGAKVGSARIGQLFTDNSGNPLVQYFQPRPSAAGDGYDPTSTSASNLGPESVVDTLPNPADSSDTGTQSLLTQVCSRSLAVGKLEGVDGSRPFCTSDGIGAVLGVFHRDGATGPVTRAVSLNQACPAKPFIARYRNTPVECARFGADYAKAVVTPIRGSAPARPRVPADAVTASGSGLDPQISVDYAHLQAPRIARERGTSVATVRRLIDKYTTGRALGFLGKPAVSVLPLNLALDRQFPKRAT